MGKKKRTSRGGRAAIDRESNQSAVGRGRAIRDAGGIYHTHTHTQCVCVLFRRRPATKTINLLSLADKQQHMLHPEILALVASWLNSQLAPLISQWEVLLSCFIPFYGSQLSTR